MCGLVLFLAHSSLHNTFSPLRLPKTKHMLVCVCMYVCVMLVTGYAVFRNSTLVRWAIRSCLALNLSGVLLFIFLKTRRVYLGRVFLWRSITCLYRGKELKEKKTLIRSHMKTCGVWEEWSYTNTWIIFYFSQAFSVGGDQIDLLFPFVLSVCVWEGFWYMFGINVSKKE